MGLALVWDFTWRNTAVASPPNYVYQGKGKTFSQDVEQEFHCISMGLAESPLLSPSP